MTAHADILDSRESLKGGFWASMALHGSLMGVALMYAWIAAHSTPIGDPTAGGAAVGVEAVKSIPLSHQGRQIRWPTIRSRRFRRRRRRPWSGSRKRFRSRMPIPIRSNDRKKKQAPTPATPHRFEAYRPEPNQLTSKTAPQVSSPLYSAQAAPDRSGGGEFGAGIALRRLCAADH